jgi:transposase, IS5 family
VIFDRGRDGLRPVGDYAPEGDRCEAGLCLVEATPRRVKSAGRQKSTAKIEEERQKRETAEGNRDKNGKPLKYRSDLESDWVVRNEKPFYGMKENASIDVDSGLKNLPKIYADKGYCGQDNRRFLSRNKIGDGIMRKEQKNAKLTDLEHERNKKISKILYKQYFGLTERHMGGGRARFTTLFKENWNRLSMVMAFNTKRVLLAERKKTQEAMA